MNKQTETALKMAYKAEETGNLQDLVDAVNMLVEVVEALEQPAKNIRDSFNEMLEDKVAYYKGKQPAQEPVAWKHFDKAYSKACNSSQPQDWMDAALLAQQARNTHPAPSWQGLTSEEIRSLDLDNDVISVIFQTEKLLKEKNAKV